MRLLFTSNLKKRGRKKTKIKKTLDDRGARNLETPTSIKHDSRSSGGILKTFNWVILLGFLQNFFFWFFFVFCLLSFCERNLTRRYSKTRAPLLSMTKTQNIVRYRRVGGRGVGFVWQNMPDRESNGVGWVYRFLPPFAAAWETETGGIPGRSRTGLMKWSGWRTAVKRLHNWDERKGGE